MNIWELFHHCISDTDNIVKKDGLPEGWKVSLDSFMDLDKERDLRDLMMLTAWSTDTEGKRSFLVGRTVENQSFYMEMQFEDGAMCDLHRHSHLELIYVVSGKLKIRIEGKDVAVKEGEQLLINSGVSHAEYLNREDCLLICLGLEDSYFAKESDIHSAMSGFIARKKSDYMFMRFSPIGNSEKTQKAYSVLLEEIQAQRPGKKHIMIGFAERIVGLLLEEFQVQVTRELKDDFLQALVEDICLYIKGNYPVVTASLIGEQYHYSPDYLGRIFRKIKGRTLSSYIQDIRMREAAKMLQTTELTVDEIALRVGYHNMGFFYRLFKNRFGTLPAAYKYMNTV